MQRLDYEKTIREAVNLREDGDYEDSVELFILLLRDFPNDPRVAQEYAKALGKLGRVDAADDVLGQAAKANPADCDVNKAWALHAAFNADSMKDHMSAIRRGRAFRAAFPPVQFPQAWESLIIEIDILYETGLFDNLEFVLEEHWNDFINYPEVLPTGLQFLSKLFLNRKMQALLAAAKPGAWAKLPAESRGNLRVRTEMALQLQQLVQDTNMQVISLGQNCLAYLAGGQWGLHGKRAQLADLTFMDRVTFYNDTAAQTIATGFADFRDPANFEFVRGFGRCRMPRHKATGAIFFHDRATFWEMPESSHFLDGIERRIANWNALISSPKPKLYVYNLCGAGDLAVLVDVVARHLLDESAHLLIIDVLQEPHTCPVHPQVTYVHAPYPRDYVWTNITYYSTHNGLLWEMTFMAALIALLKRDLSADAAAQFDAGQRAVFQRALSEARQHRHNASVESLLAAYLVRFPDDLDARVEYAHVLRARKGHEACDMILSESIAAGIHDPRLYQLWVEVAAHSARWPETIERAEQFCAVFPPPTERLAWSAVHLSLVAQYESGLWREAHEYILRHWDGFTREPDLFGVGLDMLSKLAQLETLCALIEQAHESAKRNLPQALLDNMLLRTRLALEQRCLVRNAGAKVVPIGQNTMAFALAARWGLFDEPADIDAITPFDMGDFWNDSAAWAIQDDFSSFQDRSQYDTVAVPFGGEIVQQRLSGAAFFLARQAVWDEAAWRGFDQRIDHAIANWRALKTAQRRVFLHIITQRTDAARLMSAAKDHLLTGENAHLVIIDTRAQAEIFMSEAKMTYVHKPMPDHYAFSPVTRASTKAAMAYECEILRPVIAALENGFETGHETKMLTMMMAN